MSKNDILKLRMTDSLKERVRLAAELEDVTMSEAL